MGERRVRRRLVLSTLLLVVVMAAALGIGAVSISPLELSAILASRAGIDLPWPYDERQVTTLMAIRVPRVLTSALVGAAWACAGLAMQALYRTPLADPALVGVGAGAALGATSALSIALALGIAAEPSGTLIVTLGAFTTALVAAAIVHRVAVASGGVVVATMLLAGIALTALFAALTAIVITASRDADLGSVALWSLGSLSGAGGRDVLVVAAVLLPAIGLLAWMGPRLDALALGEAEAGHLGVDVRGLGLLVSVVFVLLTAVAVAVAGVIAFVGLMVPSLARAWVGVSHRAAVIASALLGATLLVVADVLARSLFGPVELPVGVITTVLGAPFFLALMLRERWLLAR